MAESISGDSVTCASDSTEPIEAVLALVLALAAAWSLRFLVERQTDLLLPHAENTLTPKWELFNVALNN